MLPAQQKSNVLLNSRKTKDSTCLLLEAMYYYLCFSDVSFKNEQTLCPLWDGVNSIYYVDTYNRLINSLGKKFAPNVETNTFRLSYNNVVPIRGTKRGRKKRWKAKQCVTQKYIGDFCIRAVVILHPKASKFS